jgi:hypothetical protein
MINPGKETASVYLTHMHVLSQERDGAKQKTLASGPRNELDVLQ